MPRWEVKVLVKRYLTLTVEAADAVEARAQAEDWNIVDDEIVGDTIDVDVLQVRELAAS